VFKKGFHSSKNNSTKTSLTERCKKRINEDHCLGHRLPHMVAMMMVRWCSPENTSPHDKINKPWPLLQPVLTVQENIRTEVILNMLVYYTLCLLVHIIPSVGTVRPKHRDIIFPTNAPHSCTSQFKRLMGKETWGIAQAPISSTHFTSLLVQDALCIVSATAPGVLPGSVTVCAPLSRQITCTYAHSALGICTQQAYQLNFITQAWPYLVHILCGGGDENWVLILNHLQCPALNWEQNVSGGHLVPMSHRWGSAGNTAGML